VRGGCTYNTEGAYRRGEEEGRDVQAAATVVAVAVAAAAVVVV